MRHVIGMSFALEQWIGAHSFDFPMAVPWHPHSSAMRVHERTWSCANVHGTALGQDYHGTGLPWEYDRKVMTLTLGMSRDYHDHVAGLP